MKTENLVLDNGSHWDVIEESREHHPDILAPKFFLAFFVEAINLCDSSGLVVSSGQMDSIRVPNLQGD